MHQDFFNALEKDHGTVRDIMKSLVGEEGASEAQKKELFTALKAELVPHMKGEETAFYPLLVGEKGTHELGLEALEEHHVADLLLAELDGLGRSEDNWGAKMRVFREIVDHHIEEEEGPVFKAARKAIDADQMEEVFTHFRKIREQVREKMTGRPL